MTYIVEHIINLKEQFFGKPVNKYFIKVYPDGLPQTPENEKLMMISERIYNHSMKLELNSNE